MNEQPEPTIVKCPQCGTAYRVRRSAEELARIRLKCKKCAHTFTPASSAAPPPAPAPSAQAPPPPAPPPVPAAAPPAGPPAPAPAGDGAFDTLEDQIGELNRAVYQARKDSPGAIPEAVSSGVSSLNDSLMAVKRQVSSLRRTEQDLEILLEVSNALNREHDLAPLLELIMDYAIKTMGAMRGFLMLKNPETGSLEVSIARGMGEDLKDNEARAFSTGVASRVAAEGNPFFTANSKGDDRTAGFASVMRSDAKAILCVPVTSKSETLGTLYLDNRMGAPGFTEDLIRLATSFANAAGGAIENARLYENIQEETQKRASLSRYLSPSVVEDILGRGDEIELGGATVECSVLFSDVAGFTSFSERLSPHELVALMNEYFTRMADAIFKNHGTLDKFIGDATMAVFGAPVPDPNHAAWAVNAGLTMMRECNELMKEWTAQGKPTFEMRVGINSGPVVAGNLGSPQRMDYTVIGDAVNLAQRMESVSNRGSVAVSEFTWELIKDIAEGEARGPVKVKGKSEEIHVYQVTRITPPRLDAGYVMRAAPRVDTQLFVIYTQEGESGTRQGIIRNLSAGGMQIQTSFPGEVGDTLKMNFTLPPNGQVKGLPGRILKSSWEEEEGKKSYRLSMQFVEPGEDLRALISSYVQTQA